MQAPDARTLRSLVRVSVLLSATAFPLIARGQLDSSLPGSVKVTLVPDGATGAGAAWRVDGGPLQASGAEVTGLLPGLHSVDFFRPAGWSEPAAMDVVVAGGRQSEASAEYVEIPAFYFESVPAQTARHGQPLRLIVHSTDPDDPTGPSQGARLTMTASPPPVGSIAFDASSGELAYTPDPQDRTDFTVTFTAAAAGDAVTGSFLMSPLPDLAPEDSVIDFRNDTIIPESSDYVRIREAEESAPELFNLTEQVTRKVSVSGAWLVFEANSTAMNLYDRFEGREDLKELAVYADRVTIRSPLHLPQTRVEIYARELRLEAGGSIDVTPKAATTRPDPVVETDGLRAGRNGENGADAPDIVIAVETFHSDRSAASLFIARGAKGQDAGEGRNGRNILRPGTRVCETHNGSPVVFDACINLDTDEEDVRCGSRDVRCEDAVPAGRPGEGGSGGSLVSTLDLARFADLQGGAAGRKGLDRVGGRTATIFGKTSGRQPPRGCMGEFFFLIAPSPGVDRPAPSPQRAAGLAGGFQVLSDPGVWLQPLSVQSYLVFVKDLYLAGHALDARSLLFEYAERIRLLKEDLADGEERMRFDQLQGEIGSLIFRIDSNLDYFGNPRTWVPMLSFEANLSAFTTELDRAIPILYLAYWVETAATRAQSTRDAIVAAKERLGEEIDAALDEYETAQDEIPGLISESEAITVKIDDLGRRLRTLESDLLRRAEENVAERHKVPFWRKAVGVLGAIAKVIPVGQPALGFAGVGLDLLSKFDPDNPTAEFDKVPNLLKSITSTNYTACLKEKQEENKKDQKKQRKDRLARVKACGSLLVTGIKGISQVFKTTAVKSEEVKAELEKLRASEPLLGEISREIEELNAEKELLSGQVVSTLQILADFSTIVTENDLATDKLDQNLDAILDVLDHQALLDIAELGRQEEDRLLKYQYLMAKAYQFRVLKPYTGSLNLGRLFGQIRALVDADDDHELTLSDFEALKGIYLAELGRIADDILTDLNENAPARSAPVNFRLSPAEIQELNETGKLVIDLGRRNLFGASEEDLRIVDLSTEVLDVRLSGQVGGVATMRLKFEHSGYSRIRSAGHDFLFTHYRTERVNPIRWSTVYDGITDSKTETTISAATESLLRVLLGLTGASSEDVILYSLPAALTEIVISKEVTADNGIAMEISDLVLRLTYDFSERRQTSVRTLNVETNDGLLPLITVSRADIDGRSDGRGAFRRNFQGGGIVRLEAPASHGIWRFERWETVTRNAGVGGGAVAATSRAVEVAVSGDVALRAVYSTEDSTPTPGGFRRGDVNLDASVNIADVLYTLSFLFLGGPEPGCREGGDLNDDGELNVSDPVAALGFLFLGGVEIPAPGPTICGPDPTPDGLGCAAACE